MNNLVGFCQIHSKGTDTFPLTTIDSSSRKNLADFIEKLPDETCAYTCLGTGLEKGLNVRKITPGIIYNSYTVYHLNITDINLNHIKTADFLISQVLNGVHRGNKGGIIIFITDGDDTCDNHKWPDHGLENRIVEDKVRVITLALG